MSRRMRDRSSIIDTNEQLELERGGPWELPQAEKITDNAVLAFKRVI